jgi:hypothetical protein
MRLAEVLAMGKNDIVFSSNGVQYVYIPETKKIYRLVKEDITCDAPDDVESYIDVIEQTLRKAGK